MRTFHFRPVPFIATLLLVILGCSLSYWQTQRAHQKELIEATLLMREKAPPTVFSGTANTGNMEYLRVILNGEFDSQWPVYLDNRPMNGKAGIYVVMPFRLVNQNHYVLVVRGWIPRNSLDRAAIKRYDTPTGLIQIEGMVKMHLGHVFQLGQSVPLQPNVMIQNLEIDEFVKASQLPTYPFVIEQTKGTEDGLLRDWPRASSGSDRNRGYAFQWAALAGTALLFFLVTSFKRKEEQSERTNQQ